MPRKTSEGGTYSWTRPAAVSKMTKTGCCGGDDGPSLVGACRSEVIGRRRRSPHLGAGTCSEDRWERKPRHGSCSRSCDVAGLGGAAIGPSSLQSRPPCSDAGPPCEAWRGVPPARIPARRVHWSCPCLRHPSTTTDDLLGHHAGHQYRATRRKGRPRDAG